MSFEQVTKEKEINVKDCRSKSRKIEKEPKCDLASMIAFVESDLRTMEENVKVLDMKEKDRDAREIALRNENTKMHTRITLLEEKILKLECIVDNTASNDQMLTRMRLLEEKILEMERAASEKKVKPLRPKKTEEKSSVPRKARRKDKDEPNYTYYGWKGKDLSILLTCVLSGAPPLQVVEFLDGKEIPKDLNKFAKQTWTDPHPSKNIGKIIVGLKEAVEQNFDTPEKGIAGFSSTIIRRMNGWRKTAEKAEDADMEELAKRFIQIGTAQRICLRNGPPTKPPLGTPTNNMGLALSTPVDVTQVRVEPLRLKLRNPATFGGDSIKIHADNVESDDDDHDAVNNDAEKEEDDDDHDAVNNDAEEEEDDDDHDDVNDDSEKEEDDDDHDDVNDDAEKEEDDDEDDMLDMTKSFRDMCVNDWKNDWRKCKEHPSLFGVDTNARGVTRIYALLSGDHAKDKKSVLATVAHGETVYGNLANKPLGDLGEDM